MTMSDESGSASAPDRVPVEPPMPPVEMPDAPAPGEGAEPGPAAGEPTHEPQPEPEAPEPGQGPPAPEPETIVDAIADLLQMFVNWLRAEASEIMRDKVVLPIQQLGLTLASASAAGCLLVIGLIFIFIAILLVLAQWLGWPGALTLVGSLIIVGAGIFTYIKMRSIQK